MAFWRCFFAAGVTAPVAWLKHKEGFKNLSRKDIKGSLLAGLFLGLHFATWIPSLKYTSVAAATALVATQVVWAAIIARMMGVSTPRKEWIGISISLVGVVILTGIDFSLNPRALLGDLLALAGAVLAAAYMTTGQQVRPRITTSVYTTIVYSAAAVVLLVLALITGSDLSGFEQRDWILILGLTAIAQLLGHTMMNLALRSLSATTISLAILLEMPGAILIAWVWPGQKPPLEIVPALVLIMVGLVIVVRSSRSNLQTKTDQEFQP
jgi:drug/metabolite transporter (DMT)-like permease